MNEFWNNIDTEINNRFQIIEKKQSTILIDCATNIDALQNLLLGIRLLNYKKPFKTIHFLVGVLDQQFNEHEFIKTMRYFFKKNS